MRLKRLELFGFKSFADRTVMDFGVNSLTGIVGPNGCGKSNVVDSVRWVLGETRPTSLRGAGMTDVIFKGSASRQERGSEVSITRRLFKSGEGEYLIDGERVRLKDLKDMLFNTGLGSRGYSVLEQGKIDAILSANPVQRRSIFEEAAGISRYRQRRHEAELRLKRVIADVARLTDVMGELRTRVRSLKIQAGKAERWVQAKGEWTEERRRLFQHRLFGLDRALEELAPEVAELETSLEGLREMRAQCDGEIGSQEEERGAVVSELDRLSMEAARLAGEVRAIDERRTQLSMRVTAWQAAAKEEEERAAELRKQLEEREQEQSARGTEIDALSASVLAAEANVGGLTGRARELSRGYQDMRRDVQEQNDRVLEQLHERTASQNRVHHLEESRGPVAERLERALQRLAEMEESLTEVRTEAQRAAAAAEGALDTARGCEQRRERVAAEHQSVEGECANTAAEKAEVELERARAQSRIEALLDRDSELEDLSAGARRVLEALPDADGPCAADALLGLAVDHLRTDTRLARALDTVLAERAQALVARDATTAKAVVDWLRARGEGQVGVVVPAGLGQPAGMTLPSVHAGIEGKLADLVQAEPGFEALGQFLLGDVIVVENLELGFELVARHPEWRFVTPSGELVDGAGVVGGKRDVTQGAAGRRASAVELEELVRDSDARVAELDARLVLVNEQRTLLRAQLAELQTEREAHERSLSEAQGAQATASARQADLESEHQRIDEETARVREEGRRIELDLEEARVAFERAEEEFRLVNERLAEKENGRRDLESEREELAKEEGRAQVDLTRLRGELSALEQRSRDQARQMEEMRIEIARADKRSREFAESAEQGGVEGDQLGEESTRLLEERGTLDARLAELRAFERTGRERIEALRHKTEGVQSDLDSSNDRLSDRRLTVQRYELSREEVLKRSLEELTLSESDLTFGFEPEPELVGENADAALDALDRRVAELKGILDKLGPVNTEAVEELEEVGGRLEFLESQSGDLDRSQKTLAETIKKIDEESKRLFVETFETVSSNFQRIFRMLFGGGKAEIRLEEGVDVLDAGIEIVARPPGREMLSIGLLSGGQRTMTALALLFAVFEARPSPFCVLDEVDAALDDANIDRFIAMLDGFRKETQFIVVTHNKGSMASCESLYGITMETKGVSRHVSVELDDVDEFAPESTGNVRSREDRERPSEPAPAAGDGVDADTGEPVVEIIPAPAGGGELATEAKETTV